MGEVISDTHAYQEKHLTSSSSSGELSDQFDCELEHLEDAPPFWRNPNKRLSKQRSMCEIPRDIAWEKRRRQFLHQERKKNISKNNSSNQLDLEDLTDEDLNELKGCIELGFGFNEEGAHTLCNTLPALDLYLAVNRQYLTSPVSSPGSNKGSLSSPGSSTSLGGGSSSFGSPRGTDHIDAWKIYSPGEDPQQVKNKLRHWAQAVACSVKQSY